MPADDPSGARPPVVLRIKLRYEDVDAMVQRFAPNVGKSGLFIPTKSLQPIGTEVKFELRLANDQPVLVGLGRVKATKAPDPANPRAAFGMAIELMRVTREAREVIIRMIERRRAMGLADVAIPMPEDVESARRGDVETQPRAETGAIVSAAMAVPYSAPILAALPPKKKALATAKTHPGSGVHDTAVTDPPIRPTPPPASTQVLTAPRPTSGPMAVARSVTTRPSAVALAPEPVRAKRPRLTDLIARAAELSVPVAAVTVPGLDEHVDVEAAMLRARALAGSSDLDEELAVLREQSGSTHGEVVEISIEAASAELARSLGGAAISKRNRIVAEVPAVGAAGISTVSPPPPVPEASSLVDVAPPVEGVPDAIALAGDAASESGPSVAADQFVIESGPVVTESGPARHRSFIQASTVIGEAIAPAPPEVPAPRERRGTTSPPPSRGSPIPPPEVVVAGPIVAEAAPVVEPPRERAKTSPPALIVDDELDSFASALDAARVETGVTNVPLGPADLELDSFERALDAARIQTGVAITAAPMGEDSIDELDPDDIEELPGESTQIGQVAGHFDPQLGGAPVADQIHLAEAVDRQLADAESDDNELAASIRAAAAAYEAELADVPEPQAQLDDEEISDLDVLAEADANDADLLTSHGERESSDHAPAYAPPAEYAPHEHPAAPAYAQDPHAYAEADPAYAQQAYVAQDPQAYADPAYATQQPGYAAHDPAYEDQNPAYADPAYAAQAPGSAAHGSGYAAHEYAYADPDPAYADPDPAYADPACATQAPTQDPAYADPAYATPKPAHADPYAPPDPAYADPAYAAQATAYSASAVQQAYASQDQGYYTRSEQPYVPDPAYSTGPQQYTPPASPTHPTGPVQAVEPPTEGSGAKRRPFGGALDPVSRLGSDDERQPSPRSSAPPRAGEKSVVRTPTRAVIKRRAATPLPVAGDDDFDFASQLDLGDDDEGVPSEPPMQDPDAFNAPSEYTFVESLEYTPPAFAEPPGLDAALEFDDPHQFTTQTPARPESRVRAPETTRYAPDAPPADSIDFDEPHGFAEPSQARPQATPTIDDLESALSTLDVDLDHLEVPVARRRARRASTAVPGLPGMPPERAPSDPPTNLPSAQARAVVQRELAQRAAAGDRPNRTPKRRGQPNKRGTAAPPVPATKRPTPATPARAASEDDGGVLVDFDDDDK